MTKTEFRRTVLAYYRKHGRHDLPWRKTADPYRIAVSEVMLQQTQVSRVKDKYREFIRLFPTPARLARTPLSSILKTWSGLGYNRRAKYLKAMAEHVSAARGGKFPSTFDELRKLPGIGAYTAGAIMAFAYNKPSTLIETNIRTAFIHHFFNDKQTISDKELAPLVESMMDRKNPRVWYWALMDYGSHLKQMGNRTHRKSAQYAKQSAFAGSTRELRGAIIKGLVAGSKSIIALQKLASRSRQEVEAVLATLQKEGIVTKRCGTYALVD